MMVFSCFESMFLIESTVPEQKHSSENFGKNLASEQLYMQE